MLQEYCTYCGQLDIVSPNKFRKCAHEGCKLYFHTNCEEKLKKSHYYDQVQGPNFVCPAHYCKKCYKVFEPEEGEGVIKCIRCYSNYHDECFDPNTKSMYLTKTNIVCFRHYEMSRVPSTFNKTSEPQLAKLFRDPQLKIGNSELLNRYKNDHIQSLPVSIPKGLNVAETIITMEKLLNAVIDKDQQILKAAKNINILQKKDLLYLNEKAGKKISSDEVYVLSQKNLIQTLDYLHEKTRFKMQKDMQNEKIEEDLKDEVKNAEIHPTCPPPENKRPQNLPKPVSSGLKRTATMISRLFGGHEARRKIQKRFEKTFDDVVEFLESGCKKKEDQHQPFVDLSQIIEISTPPETEQVNTHNSLFSY
jgi:hypothetical protein